MNAHGRAKGGGEEGKYPYGLVHETTSGHLEALFIYIVSPRKHGHDLVTSSQTLRVHCIRAYSYGMHLVM